jgi:hypothetical protein
MAAVDGELGWFLSQYIAFWSLNFFELVLAVAERFGGNSPELSVASLSVVPVLPAVGWTLYLLV